MFACRARAHSFQPWFEVATGMLEQERKLCIAKDSRYVVQASLCFHVLTSCPKLKLAWHCPCTARLTLAGCQAGAGLQETSLSLLYRGL